MKPQICSGSSARSASELGARLRRKKEQSAFAAFSKLYGFV
jgi:hypothetical protein